MEKMKQYFGAQKFYASEKYLEDKVFDIYRKMFSMEPPNDPAKVLDEIDATTVANYKVIRNQKKIILSQRERIANLEEIISAYEKDDTTDLAERYESMKVQYECMLKENEVYKSCWLQTFEKLRLLGVNPHI